MIQQSVPQDSLVRSYLTLRKAVGIIGCALPFVLALGKMLTQSSGIQGSISCYYYTDMRDVFVGSLCAIGIFLMSTRGYDWRDELFGILACVFAIGVAFFPTTPCTDPAPRFHLVGFLHLAFAAALFLTLAFFSIFLFTETDPHKIPTRQKIQRNRVYLACGWIIIGCIFVMAAVELTPLKGYVEWLSPVFWLESTAIISFGVSWLTKGEAILKDDEAPSLSSAP